MKLHVGCAMWTYPPWQGRYLPGSLAPRNRLSAYATWCNAVEGNTTFYATPALADSLLSPDPVPRQPSALSRSRMRRLAAA